MSLSNVIDGNQQSFPRFFLFNGRKSLHIALMGVDLPLQHFFK
jgi:hypothetical protein